MQTQVNELGCDVATRRTPARRSLTLIMVALAGATALAVVIPFIFLGNASGHDFEFHLASWMDVARQWREGVLYPRWAALANWGFGEPRFIFYPPASWMLGAALSFVFSWQMVPGAFIWLALTVAGVAMFTLARKWLPAGDAMAAGVLFAINPYHLVIVYWRSDFAELLASALIPLAMLFAMRTAREPRQALPPLALVVAAIWLSNAPAAVVVTYVIALVLLVVAAHEWSAGPLICGGATLALGLTLAGFYIVPAAFEQSWVNISEVLSKGLRIEENFLFTRTADAEHTFFNFIVSWVAVGVMVATLASMIGAGRLRREQLRLWWILAALVAASTILMLPVSAPLWTWLPKLRYVQFPWRCLLVLDVTFAFFLAAAMGRLRGAGKHAAWAIMLAGLAIAGFLLTRNNWWDSGGVAHFYEEHFSVGAGYFGSDEYGPRGSDHYDLNRQAPLVSFENAENVRREARERVEVRRWAPLRRHFIVHSSQPVTAALHLLNYPAWHVEVNGEPAPASSNPQTGQMLISLPAGASRVQVTFATTPDRLWGDAISAAAAMILAGLVLAFRRRQHPGSGARRT